MNDLNTDKQPIMNTPPVVSPEAWRAAHSQMLVKEKAMTRARDRLYVAGFEGRKGPEPGCWYELIRNGLEGALERATAADGREVLRLAAPQTAAPEPPKVTLTARHGAAHHQIVKSALIFELPTPASSAFRQRSSMVMASSFSISSF